MRPLRGLLILLAVPIALDAQNAVVRLVVSDSLGQRVPFAYAHLGTSAGRVASDSGVVEFRSDSKDSLKFVVRRIGYAPFGGWVRRDATSGEYHVAINPLARQLSEVNVRGLPNGPLVRAGFYDRLERARRGATVARFITPEEIELRNPTRVTQLLENENIVKIKRMHGNWSVVSGRSNCPMALVVDGMAMRGTAEEILTRDGEIEIQEIMRQSRMMRYTSSERRVMAEREFLSVRNSIDDIVTSLSVAAIEIYSSVAGAPPELLRNTPGETCGLVVVWTGSRR
jgi:hypothetical protein